MAVANVRVMGRATQGVRLINLTKKNDTIASVCKVMSSELEATVEEESRQKWNETNEKLQKDIVSQDATPDADDTPETSDADDNNTTE